MFDDLMEKFQKSVLSNRRSGRTHKKLHEAAMHVYTTKEPVIYLVHSHKQGTYIINILRNLYTKEICDLIAVRIKDYSGLTRVSSFEFRGAGKQDKTFIDHYVHEMLYLDELNKFLSITKEYENAIN